MLTACVILSGFSLKSGLSATGRGSSVDEGPKCEDLHSEEAVFQKVPNIHRKDA